MAARPFQETQVLPTLPGEDPPGMPFRLVIARAKRDRLTQHAAGLDGPARCPVDACGQSGLHVLLAETEQVAVLCPNHLLVDSLGQPILGEPLLVTRAW